MPLGGKEIKDNLEESENFKKLGEEVILNLLMRVFQRSDEGALKRASEEKGLLLVHMHPKRMQKELPFIKSEWIRDGDTKQYNCVGKKLINHFPSSYRRYLIHERFS